MDHLNKVVHFRVFRGCIIDPILVTAAIASTWTGRPVGTIWRWASEGRINRYGGTGKDVRYDLRELPPATEAGPGPAPPLPVGAKAA
ncbi:DNA-binding protein [Streptomyces sp. NPDC020794]|uniref:DNA-binding protein n=1 Tax=unclassified Streptomyces TaxID=2593676 RepID=UPI0036E8D3D2